MHQHDFGLFEGRVRSTGAHRHADVRGGQTGRVVDTIADHGHEEILPGEGLNDGDLLLRFQFGTDVVELEFFFQMFGIGFAVAGQHHGSQPFATELLHDRARLRPDVVAQQDATDQIPVGQPDLGKAGLGRLHLGQDLRDCALTEPFAPSEQNPAAFMPGF